eukprot:SAG25_NODE_361_length_9156_cov_9.406647_15_plen_167_part_00
MATADSSGKRVLNFKKLPTHRSERANTKRPGCKIDHRGRMRLALACSRRPNSSACRAFSPSPQLKTQEDFDWARGTRGEIESDILSRIYRIPPRNQGRIQRCYEMQVELVREQGRDLDDEFWLAPDESNRPAPWWGGVRLWLIRSFETSPLLATFQVLNVLYSIYL